MKKGEIYVLILMSVLVISCIKGKQEPGYHWVRGENSINVISKVKRLIKEDTTFLSYFANDTLNYILLSKNRDSSLIGGSYQHGYIRSFKDTTINTNGNTFKVIKYIQNEDVIDGGVIHYYNPEFGVFAIHSNTWPGLTYLQSTDSVQNKRVKLLIKATVPEFNIRGKLKTELEKLKI